VNWTPFNETEKLRQEEYLSGVLLEGLRKLTPGMGAYVNEVCFHGKIYSHGTTDSM
jgi:hypothetical protein